jgi:hypothetical protein
MMADKLREYPLLSSETNPRRTEDRTHNWYGVSYGQQILIFGLFDVVWCLLFRNYCGLG